MDKLLGILADFLKLLFTVSPTTAVLFVILCGACWALRFLYLQNKGLTENQVAQQEKFQAKMTAALAEREESFRKQLEAKDNEINILHERTFERDQATGKSLEQLRLTIARSNQAPILSATWNGIHAICQYHKIDGRAAGLWNHMNPVTVVEPQ